MHCPARDRICDRNRLSVRRVEREHMQKIKTKWEKGAAGAAPFCMKAHEKICRFRNFGSARADYHFAGREWRACKKRFGKKWRM